MFPSLRLPILLVALLIGMPAIAQPRSFAVQRADGSQINYHIDRGKDGRRQPILLLMQGSGCEPVIGNSRIASAGPAIAPHHAILTIEKYGVDPVRVDDTPVDGCSMSFWNKNTLQQRVFDAAQVIARLRQESWWNREIILFGGSEGGATVAMLAPLVPETKAVIVFSSGIGLPVGDLIRKALPAPFAAEAEGIFREAKAAPTGEKRWGGASYRWWADAVDLLPARSLLQTPAPTLLIHGSRDQSAPIVSARATRDLFAAAGNGNLTYREYEGYDHFMVDEAGVDQRPEVFAAAARWLRELPKRR